MSLMISIGYTSRRRAGTCRARSLCAHTDVHPFSPRLPEPSIFPVFHLPFCRLFSRVTREKERSDENPSFTCRRYNTADDGHADIRDKRLTATGILHEGYRRLDGGMLDLRIRRSPRIRAGQLRVAQRHAQRQHKEAVSGERDGTFVVDRSILGAARARRIRQLRHGQYPETTFLERRWMRVRDGFEIAARFSLVSVDSGYVSLR